MCANKSSFKSKVPNSKLLLTLVTALICCIFAAFAATEMFQESLLSNQSVFLKRHSELQDRQCPLTVISDKDLNFKRLHFHMNMKLWF